MSATLNSQTIQLANHGMALMQSLAGRLQDAQAFVTQFVALNATAQLEAMPTCATNTDGTLGTADATPTSGHVIDTRVVTDLNRAIAAYDLGVIENRIADVISLTQGNAVAAQNTWPAELAKAVGG